MCKVVLYTTRFCPYCIAAKRLLEGKQVDFEEIFVDRDASLRVKMQAVSGRKTVPQIFIGDQHVGGFTDLLRLDRAGELDDLLGRV